MTECTSNLSHLLGKDIFKGKFKKRLNQVEQALNEEDVLSGACIIAWLSNMSPAC